MRELKAFIIGVLVVFFMGYAETANAANFTVTKSTNSNDGVCDADCSLREAVAAADSGDTVVFSSSLVGQTFVLGGQEIVITKRITIDGFLNNPNVAFISGSNTSRIFLIEAGAALDLRNAVLVQGNSASSNFDSGRGSAINAKQNATLLLDRVLVRNNTATVGAIVLRTGTHHMMNSSFSVNTASTCIAIANEDSDANLYMANVTLTSNFDPGNDGTSSGAICNNGNLTIRNSTIAYNISEVGGSAGGIFNVGGGVLNLGNTIVAQNTAAFAPDIDSINSTVISVGGNLIGNTEGTPAGTFTQQNDITGVNPLLGPLNANNASLNGFPIMYHMLQAGSPARNGGLNANAVDPLSNAPLITDTRGAGFSRILATTVDIGAFEDDSGGTSLVVSKNANGNDLVCDADCSLREAVHQAALNSGTDTITFAPNVFGTVDLGGSEIVIQNQNVNIVGFPNFNANALTVSGGNTSRIFAISNSSVRLTGMTLANGNGVGMFSGAGGAIQAFNDSNVTLDRVIMRDNVATNYGAMQATGGVTRIINSTVTNNSANSSLAIGIVGGTLYMANATVTANIDADGGTGLGALHLNGSVATIRNSTIAFNRTPGGSGGGIYLISSSVDLGNTIVSNNIASSGPDIFRSSGSLTSAGGNLVQDVNGFPGGTFNQTMDHTGFDPQLDALTDNGGNVPTHAVHGFSVAIGKGVDAKAVDPFDNSPLTGDARGAGFPRIQNGVDKGAYESAAPTAANAAVSGRVIDEQGLAVAGAVINLSGTQIRKTITDASGNYRFDEVETNGFYTVTPSRANYNFMPGSRSLSQLGNQTEAIFTATATGYETNPLDTPEFFVRQQYVDILGREPDEGGFNYWSDQILACGGDTDCADTRRDVAAAFFISEEYQASGSYIYDVYAAALGRHPAYAEYSIDRQLVVGGATLDAAKTAFAHRFVQREEFATKYQEALTAESFVDAMLQNVHSSTMDLSGERGNLIAAYNATTSIAEGRAAVVRAIADNATYKQSQYNQAFVLTGYFSYLRRDPDEGGFVFWLNVLNSGDRGDYRGIVCSFITSSEYQRRFSPVVSRSNGECGK